MVGWRGESVSSIDVIVSSRAGMKRESQLMKQKRGPSLASLGRTAGWQEEEHSIAYYRQRATHPVHRLCACPVPWRPVVDLARLDCRTSASSALSGCQDGRREDGSEGREGSGCLHGDETILLK